MHPIHPSLTYPIHPPFFHPFQSNNIYCDSIGSKNFEWTSRTGASRYTPSQHILSTHYINTLLQHTNTPYQHTIPTHPTNTPSLHNLSTNLLNPPYQHTLSIPRHKQRRTNHSHHAAFGRASYSQLRQLGGS